MISLDIFHLTLDIFIIHALPTAQKETPQRETKAYHQLQQHGLRDAFLPRVPYVMIVMI